MPTFQKPYTKTKRVKLDTGEGLTEQAHKKQCDMNYILREYSKTGLITHSKDHQGRYDDISVQDFQEAMFLVAQAQNMFNDLPADMRKRFQNDPAQFIAFTSDPSNRPEMEVMGILQGNDGIDRQGQTVNSPQVAPPAPEATIATQEPSSTS